MKKLLKIMFLSIFSLIFFGKTSFAYFDPGSGAFIVQAIIVFFSALIYYLFHPIMSFKRLIEKIKKKFSRKKKAE